MFLTDTENLYLPPITLVFGKHLSGICLLFRWVTLHESFGFLSSMMHWVSWFPIAIICIFSDLQKSLVFSGGMFRSWWNHGSAIPDFLLGDRVLWIKYHWKSHHERYITMSTSSLSLLSRLFIAMIWAVFPPLFPLPWDLFLEVVDNSVLSLGFQWWEIS